MMDKTETQEQIERLVTNGLGINADHDEIKPGSVYAKHNDSEWDLQARLLGYEQRPQSDQEALEFWRAAYRAQCRQENAEKGIVGKAKACFGYGPLSEAKTADDVNAEIAKMKAIELIQKVLGLPGDVKEKYSA
jgi:hypothetical protein